MKVFIERDDCIGCGACVDICPEVFRLADDGFAEAYGEVTDANSAAVREAAESCPVEVIAID